MSVAVFSFRRYFFSGVSREMVRRTASMQFCWPRTTFRQEGESESSKSAMKMSAPELRALIIIFRSVGPVISTWRRWRSLGVGATFQSPPRIDFVEGRESKFSPRSSAF